MAKKKKSIFKRILRWFGVFVLLLLIFAIIAPYIFKDEIIQFIEEEAEKSLNADLELGEVDLSFISTFPDFVLTTEGTSLTGKDEFDGVTLFGTKNMEVSLDLYSVIFGSAYQIQTISLNEPEINILVTKNGVANYDIYISDSTVTEESVEEGKASPFKLALQSYELINGKIVYSDSTMAFDLKLDSLNHSGSGDFTLEELVLSTVTTSSGVTMSYENVAYLDKVDTEIKADIKMNLSKMHFEFQENDARLNLLHLGFDGWFAMADDFYDMDISFDAKESKFMNLLSMVPGAYSPDFGDIKTDGSIGFSGRIFEKYSETSMPGFDVKLNVNNAFFQYPDLPGKVSNINVKSTIKREAGNDLDNLVVRVEKAHAEFSDNYVDASLLLTRPMTDPNFTSTIGSYIDLAKLSDVLPMEEGDSYSGIIESDLKFKGVMSSIMEERYEDFEASGVLSVKNIDYKTKTLPYDVKIGLMEMAFDPHNITLSSFVSNIGETDIAASGIVDNYLKYVFKDEPLHGDFDVASAYINLDELMSSVPEDETAKELLNSGGEDVSEQPYEVILLPENVDFSLNADIKELFYDSLSIKNVKGNVGLSQSVAKLNEVEMDLLGGNMIMSGSYDTKNIAEPKIAVDMKIDHFEIGETARYFNTVDKLMPIANKCKGFFSSSINFNTVLDQYWMPVYSTIFSKGDFFTKRVFVEGFEPLNKLAKAVKIDKLSKQTINDVKCFFNVSDGKVHVDPFDVKLANIKSTIAGYTSFEQDLNYAMDMDIPRSALGSQANGFVDGLTSQAAANGLDIDVGSIIPVTVHITGKVTDPKISTNLHDIGHNILDDIKEEVIEQVTDAINEQLENLDEEIQAKVDKLLADAQAQADKLRAEAKKQADAVRLEGKKLADKARAEGYAQADKLIKEAGNNPLAVVAAKKAAEKLRNETDKKADNIESEADKNANKIESEADKKANAIMSKAEADAEKIKLDQRVGQ